MTEGLIDDEKGSFRSGIECVDEIFTVKQIGKKVREKKWIVYVNFMYANSLICVRLKGGESERFRIDSSARQGCIVSLGSPMCIYRCKLQRFRKLLIAQKRQLYTTKIR